MQLSLFPYEEKSRSVNETICFSHDHVNEEKSRLALEEKYAFLLVETDKFSRKLVSYQGNKGKSAHRWIKYKEAFSSQLVELFIKELGINPRDTLLEPFAGSATTMLTSQLLGINTVSVELLPTCRLIWDAKSDIKDYDIAELQTIYKALEKTEPQKTEDTFSHITITQHAFPLETENELLFYKNWITGLNVTPRAKTLYQLILLSILEEVSYTQKDGQYLRWDYRSAKVHISNEKRKEKGRKPVKKVDKGNLPMVKKALMAAFETIINDIAGLQKRPFPDSTHTLFIGNILTFLPTLADNTFDGVITSPPYCNRYDYTRTYALELAYLGIGEQEIRALRQNQLSCTVENNSKLTFLESYYASRNQKEQFNQIIKIVQQNAALEEINQALKIRWERGEINNKGVLTMIDGYFTELTFVIAEIYRTCKNGSHVVFVNDNVRYGGEIIPVDLLSTNLAEAIGFKPIEIHVLPQRKGNSSQQMGKFGRAELRKSITVWKKE